MGCIGYLLIDNVSELFSLLLLSKFIRICFRLASGSYWVGSVSEGFNFVATGAAVLIKERYVVEYIGC